MISYPLSMSTWDHEEHEAIQRVLRTGRTTMGEEVRAFEREFADYHGRKHAIAVNSGSSANLIATAALYWRSEMIPDFYEDPFPLYRGAEVIVPAISWATTYHPLHQHGFKLRFMDVELDTLNMDTSKLEGAITPDTRMIVGVSILGNPAALFKMRKFAWDHGLSFLEDNCESLDADAMGDGYKGEKTGTFGDLSTFSFFFSHHIQTMEGGMITTDDDELAHLCLSLRAHGWTRDLPPDQKLFDASKSDRYEAYRFILPGYNVRPLEIAAAIGRVQLRKLPEFTRIRRANLGVFQKLFADDPRFIIQRENGKSSAFSFPIIINPEWSPPETRDAAFKAMTEAGIEHRVVTGGNFLRHDVIKHYDYSVVDGGTPNADIVHDYGFFVGNYPFDLTEQLHHLHDVLDKLV